MKSCSWQLLPGKKPPCSSWNKGLMALEKRVNRMRSSNLPRQLRREMGRKEERQLGGLPDLRRRVRRPERKEEGTIPVRRHLLNSSAMRENASGGSQSRSSVKMLSPPGEEPWERRRRLSTSSSTLIVEQKGPAKLQLASRSRTVSRIAWRWDSTEKGGEQEKTELEKWSMMWESRAEGGTSAPLSSTRRRGR
eukprot:Lithocolla_globosa_v1_NODE_3841_length_1566_cov_28.560556.p2 type:complete len:193 gc:universal NODE_3841_length_1566_cov_28.560556:881-303(-)